MLAFNDLRGIVPEVGSTWEWEPLTSARETVRVVEVFREDDECWVVSERLDGTSRCTNDLSRWIQAAVLVEPSPVAVDPSTISPGLYRVGWTSGGESDVAVGIARNGDRWMAATNWVEHTSTDRWGDVLWIKALKGEQ